MNYFVDSALSLIGIQLLKTGIEHFTYLNETLNYLGGGENKYNKFRYTENKRLNYNFGKYPPCFNLSFEARDIFDTLDIKGEHEKYFKLFDIYSILLCQKYHASYKECNPKMIEDRINDLQKMLPGKFDQEKVKIKISKYIKLNKSKISKLIIMAYYLIEKEIKKINDFKIKELNHKFYFAVFKELFILCDGF
jgi:hypothetical protein